jgi:S1-C subfamily serine protease
VALSASASDADARRDAAVETVQKVMPSVVNIATEEVVPVQHPFERLFRDFFDPYYRRLPPNTQYSLGSGVIIDEEGFVLTNFHVVSRAKRIWVKLADGREFEAEPIIGTSKSDVALLKIKTTTGEKFASVKFAADDDLMLGETVLALGNPFGLGGSVSRGILSSKSRRPPTENEPLDVMDWLQTDAAINPGNSGGPLVNLRGELIGINVAVYREGQGIGFAIPVKRVAAAISDIYSPEWLEQMWFGARVRPGSSPLQITLVQPESPAAKAGLHPGDQVLQVNGRAPRSFIDFNRELTTAKDKQDVALLIKRGTERRNVKLRLVPEKTFFDAALVRRRTGAVVQELTPELARAFGYVRFDGLLIAEVDRGSPAAAVGLGEGMLLTALDGQSTRDVVTAAKVLYGRGKGQKVQLEVIMPRRIGRYIDFVQTTTELAVR